MRTHHKDLIVALLLAAAPAAVLAQDVTPAPAPPPPSMDDPGQPAAEIKPDDPRLAPLPAESAPTAPDRKTPPKGHEKSDGDPTNLPAMPTDDAFHPPPKKASGIQSADGYSVRSYTAGNGDHIEEYRHGGALTKVRVKPANGPAFELDDSNHDGRINRNDATSSQTVPVQWSLLSGIELIAGCRQEGGTAIARDAGATQGGVMKRPIVIALAVVLAGAAAAQNPPSMPKSPNEPAGVADAPVATGSNPDAGFYRQALAGGVHEILLSQQAAIRANSAEVRSLANMLASDHLAMDRELSETGKATIPSPTPADRRQDADLQRASGALFDTTYLAAMQQDHEKAIALFNATMLNAHDPATRDLATTGLQSLRRHLGEIQLQQRRLSGP